MGNMITDALSSMLGKSSAFNGNQNAINSALQVFSSVKDSANPMSALQAMASMNPQISKAMEIVNQNGGNPKAAFMKLAQQSGIDPNTILKLIR